MATYRVFSGASGAANGTSWTDAYTTLNAAINAATVAGDDIWVASDHIELLGADVTWTIPGAHVNANPLKILSVARADDALFAGALIGHTSLNRSITIAGGSYYMYGVTLQVHGTTTGDSLNLTSGTRQFAQLEACNLKIVGNTNSGSAICFGSATDSQPSLAITKGCSFYWGHTSQGITLRGRWESYGDNTSAGATHPNYLIELCDTNGGGAYLEGADISNIGTIVQGTNATAFCRVELVNCRMKSGFVLLGASTANASSGEVHLRDCSDGDQHYHIGYANFRGTLLVDTGVYANDNICATPLSWKVVTTANCSTFSPFCGPWISREHSATSAITPYLEVLRHGSTTAYTDAEVWAETMAKTTAGSARSTHYMDRVMPRATAANQAASSKTAADWTGEHASSNWFGLLGQASVTPAEAGFLRMRVCVGVPSETLYIDPQVRV